MDTVLKNFSLIDGTGREPIADAVIAISEGKIIYAGSASGWNARVELSRNDAGQAITVDLHGQYVLPGLIDAHVHLSGSGEADSQFYAPTGAMALKILSNAQKNLAAGITTVRDLAAGANWNSMCGVRSNAENLRVHACVWLADLFRLPKQARIIMWACIAWQTAWMKCARRCVSR